MSPISVKEKFLVIPPIKNCTSVCARNGSRCGLPAYHAGNHWNGIANSWDDLHADGSIVLRSASMFLVHTYKAIQLDVHRSTSERIACELIVALEIQLMLERYYAR